MRPRANCSVLYRTYPLDVASSWTALMKAMKHDRWHWILALSRWSHRIRCGQSRGRSRSPGVPSTQRDRATLSQAQGFSPHLQSLRQARCHVHGIAVLRTRHRSTSLVLTGPRESPRALPKGACGSVWGRPGRVSILTSPLRDCPIAADRL